MTDRFSGALVAVCTVAAVGLRLWGIGQGYPDMYGHVDEIGVAASIWNFFRAGTLEPTEFTYPALFSYAVAAGIWLIGLVGGELTGGSLRETIAVTSYTDPALAALVGRTLSAVADSLTIIPVYLLGRKVTSTRTALTAAVFYATAVLPVARAHMALPDSLMTALSTLVVYFSWRIYERGGWSDYVVAGLCAGLAIATKYNCAFIALAIPAAHVLGSRRREGGYTFPSIALHARLAFAVLAAVAALAVGSPYLVLAHEQYLGVALYQVSSLGFSLQETSRWWWIPVGIVEGEWVVGAMMMLALGWGVVKRHPLDLILLAAWIPSFLYIGSWTRQSPHYLLHFYPVLALSAARLIASITSAAGSSLPQQARVALTWALPLLCVVPNLWRVIQRDSDLHRTDTRWLAAEWIRTEAPNGSALAMTWLPYCPRLDLEVARSGVRDYFSGNPRALAALERHWQGKPAYRLVNLEAWRKEPFVPEAYRGHVDLKDPETRRVFTRGWRGPEHLRRLGVEYVVLPDAVFERYLHPRTQSPPAGTAAHFRYHTNRAYYRLLMSTESGLELVAVFGGGRAGESSSPRGGRIQIYRMTQPAAKVKND